MALAGVMRNLLFGIEPIDPITFATGAAVAYWWPLADAWRRPGAPPRCNPGIAMRTE